MRAQNYFMATLKEDPKEAQNTSHRLMLRAGMIQRVSPGIYTWLPLGLKVLRSIEAIVRQEQERAGALEILAATLQPAELWKESGRYDAYGKELLRLWDRHEKELLYGPTAEEVFTHVFRTHVHSYRQLPCLLYNIQWKFRDEIRPRFGVMRGREFLMKDAYSFDLTPQGAKEAYASMFSAYMKTFKCLGLKAIPVRAATGPIGGDLSHEFHILADTGESTLYYDAALEQEDFVRLEDFASRYAMADEEHNPLACPLASNQLKASKGIEVGHIFYFGTKYSEAMKAFVSDGTGNKVLAEMGSYGIGISRLVGAIIEANHDKDGIVWPLSVAPFLVAILSLGGADNASGAQDMYRALCSVCMGYSGATDLRNQADASTALSASTESGPDSVQENSRSFCGMSEQKQPKSEEECRIYAKAHDVWAEAQREPMENHDVWSASESWHERDHVPSAKDHVFYYDLPHSSGQSFANIELMGFPYYMVFGATWQKERRVEITCRRTRAKIFLSQGEAVGWFQELLAKRNAIASGALCEV